MSISFVAKVIKNINDERRNIGLLAFDENSKQYTMQGTGKTSPLRRRINFSTIINEFEHDSLVEFTIKEVKKK